MQPQIGKVKQIIDSAIKFQRASANGSKKKTGRPLEIGIVHIILCLMLLLMRTSKYARNDIISEHLTKAITTIFLIRHLEILVVYRLLLMQKQTTLKYLSAVT